VQFGSGYAGAGENITGRWINSGRGGGGTISYFDDLRVSGVGVQVSVFPHSLIIRRYIPTRHSSTLSANKMVEKDSSRADN